MALVEDGKKILCSITSSQLKKHDLYSGVVPEIASREHVKLFLPTLDLVLSKASVDTSSIDAIAVTVNPGLSGALMVGVQAAKTLALVLKKPLVAVNHLIAHFYALDMSCDVSYPYLALLASGGHTLMVRVLDPLSVEVLATTKDDACGECFDKVAKHYQLGFPGGPILEKKANAGDENRYNFPVSSFSDKAPLSFSYSGLKTAVVHHVEKYDNFPDRDFSIFDVVASFQKAAFRELIEKAMQFIDKSKDRAEDCSEDLSVKNIKHFGICGGVASNLYFRKMAERECKKRGLSFIFPPFELCTDNAAMVGGLAYHKMKKEQFFSPDDDDFFSLQVSSKKVREEGFLT